MSAYAAITQSGTQALAASVVDTVTFDSDCNEIEVWADGALTFSIGPETPSVGAVTDFSLPVAGTRVVGVRTAGNTRVKLIAVVGCNYNVTKIS